MTERKPWTILANNQKWRAEHFIVLDLLDKDLSTRFDQADLKIAACREKLFLTNVSDDDDAECM